MKRRCGVLLACFAIAALSDSSKAAPRSLSSQTQQRSAVSPVTGGGVAMKLRRTGSTVELVVEGVGGAPVLQQTRSGNEWVGELQTSSTGSLRVGPQSVTLPESGMKSVSLQGEGNRYALRVVPMPGAQISRPVVTADGQNLIIAFPSPQPESQVTADSNLREPGVIPQPSYAPPLRRRAVAPPLGDMAVGSMLIRNQSYVNVSGPNVTLTLRNAPAKDALMAMAQLGGYGFVFVDGEDESSAAAATVKPDAPRGRSVTIAFRDESYSRALNSVLIAAGLQGKREGNMIFVGSNVGGQGFGPQLSKVYRLNQASAASAADYLASLGASITKVTVITNTVTQGTPQANDIAGGTATQQTRTQDVVTAETYGASRGPLKGLTGTTDSRLQTITLIGDSQLVSVAENYLRQLDLRQRQVALSVKILDVSLDNDSEISNSFAFRSGTNFIVNDNGSLAGVFGGFVPPLAQDVGQQAIPEDIEATQSTDGITWTAPPGVEARGRAGQVQGDGTLSGGPFGGMTSGVRPNPGLQYPANQFYDLVKASIASQSTKVLASPTLIISENPEAIRGGQEVSVGAQNALSNATIGRPYANESYVTVGTQVVTDYTVQAGQNGAPNSCQPEFGTAGLTFGARVTKIDDNGFVTFSLSPSVSATTGQQQVEGCGLIDVLSVRRLDTGTVRVRDGQTLILTGVIQDVDSQVVTKWPILGDLPLIGQFFRRSGGSRRKNELVILVTPRIVDDTQGGSYGYGYDPATGAARRLMSGSF